MPMSESSIRSHRTNNAVIANAVMLVSNPTAVDVHCTGTLRVSGPAAASITTHAAIKNATRAPVCSGLGEPTIGFMD